MTEVDLEAPTAERAMMILKADRPVEADLVWRRVDPVTPNSAESAMLELRLAQARRDPVRLMAAADTILKRTPRRPDLNLARARASYALGRLDEGVERIRSIQLPPGHPQMGQVRWWHARLLIRAGRYEEAATIDESLLQHPKMHPAAEVQLGEIALLTGRTRDGTGSTFLRRHERRGAGTGTL